MPVTLGRVVFSDKEDVEMSLGRKSLIPILFLVVAFAGTWAPVWAQNKYAYVANWTDNTVSGYLRDATTGALTQITGSPWATGNAPASVAVDQTGNCVFVANFLSNNVSAYKITASTGVLTQVTGSPFPTGTAPIAVAVDFFTELVYVANAFDGSGSLGSISAFKTSSATCALTAVAGSPFPAPGATTPQTPSSQVPDRGGSLLYVEKKFSNKILGVNIATTCTAPCTPSGAMTEITSSPYRTGTGPTSVAVDPSGKFAYVTSMISNNVWGYNIDGTTGACNVSGAPVPAGQFAISVFFTP